MALKAEDAIGFARKYTDSSIKGVAGALAGKNCQVSSIEDIEISGITGKKITLSWYDNDNIARSTSFNVMDGKIGEDGYSPEITVKTSTATSYILHIKTEDSEFDTPNLKGGGSGGTTDYNDLENKPTINGAELTGDMTLEDIGDTTIPDDDIISAVNLAFGN